MRASVCELIYFFRLTAILRMCWAYLNTSRFVFSSSLKPSELATTTVVICIFFYSLKIFRRWNTSQVSNCSNQVLGSFPLHLLNIPILPAHWCRLVQLWNLYHGFDLSLYGATPGLLNKQPVLRENYKDLIFTWTKSRLLWRILPLQYSQKEFNSGTLPATDFAQEEPLEHLQNNSSK